MAYSCGGENNPYVKVNLTTYTTVRYIRWCGCEAMGNPTKIYVIMSSEGLGDAVAARVYDSTNAQVIAEKTDISDNSPTTYDLGAISNVPSSSAVWEIQIKRIDNSAVRIYCFNIEF